MSKLPSFVMKPDGDGEDNPGGEGDDKNKGEPSAEVKLLTQTVAVLSQGLEEMQRSQASIADVLTKLQEGGGPSKGDKGQIEEEDADLFKDVDVDSMSQAQLAKFLLDNVGKVLEAKISKLSGRMDERIDGLAGEFQQKNASEQVQKLSEKNADFFEWAPEIKRLLQENPTLSVQRAYSLARSENPEKVATMAKKYKTEVKEVKGKPKTFGLTPTSSRSTEGTGKMSAREAAEKALDEVLGEVDGLLSEESAFR